jgi:hypothetical protein
MRFHSQGTLLSLAFQSAISSYSLNKYRRAIRSLRDEGWTADQVKRELGFAD